MTAMPHHDSIEISAAELFQYADMESLEGYLENCGEKHLQAGDILLSPERDNQNIYILLSGRLNIHLNSIKTPPLTQVGAGECLGEISIIDRQDPSAYVVAETPAKLLVIHQDILWAMVNASHMVAKNLLYILTRRLRHGHEVIMDGIKLQTQLQHHAVIDGLTGLHNRRWFDDAIERKLKRSNVNGGTLCLLLVDIDHFKVFNDEFGHLAGDQVLRAVAGVLNTSMRPDDMTARFGGDEFVIILPDTEATEAFDIAERLRQDISGLSVSFGEQPHLRAVTVSLGISSLQPNDSVETLFQRADDALYQAKQQGRDCIGRDDG